MSLRRHVQAWVPRHYDASPGHCPLSALTTSPSPIHMPLGQWLAADERVNTLALLLIRQSCQLGLEPLRELGLCRFGVRYYVIKQGVAVLLGPL